jgi:hypothetical protein
MGSGGRPFDPSARGIDPEDRGAVRALTDELMDELGRLVADLRRRYPARWTRG